MSSGNGIAKLDPKKHIIIKGAEVHNLKKVDVAFPRNHFIVITGVSGSGKSSLAFDTLYAEGQRRYVESLSSYARQFIGRMDKPKVEYINGIAPAIAIEQKVNTRNPRSTVGTSTEIYDYLKLLYARIGKTISPVSGKAVKKHSVSDVVDYTSEIKPGNKLFVFAPLLHRSGRTINDELNILLQKGFARVEYTNEVFHIEDLIEQKVKGFSKKKPAPKKSDPENYAEPLKNLNVLIDRLAIESAMDEDTKSRIADSAQTAFNEGEGTCIVKVISKTNKSSTKQFSNKFELDGMTFEKPSLHLFSFNNPYGACKRCEGFGSIIGIDDKLVIPDTGLSIYDGAIACWRSDKMKAWNKKLIKNAYKFDFPIHKPYYKLNKYQKKLLWDGNEYFNGLNDFFVFIEEQSYKIQYRVMLSRYRGKTICPECNGTRLRGDANYVKVGKKSISEIVLMPVDECHQFFKNLKLNANEKSIAKRILVEINNRLEYLCNVGLGYLTLNRLSNSLSGGESQRINLSTSLGSSLVGSMYILDEPSIGLHPRDTNRLISVLKSLQKLGNTLIIVEHEEEIMKSADHIVDIGPQAGSLGGELVYKGDFKTMLSKADTLTAKYLNGKFKIDVPETRRNWKKYITVIGAKENNLQNITVKFPLNTLTVVTGVSGSGKTSLVKQILSPALQRAIGGYNEHSGNFERLDGHINEVENVEMVDQNPIGKSSRSNPVTYIKAYDEIRHLYSELPLSKSNHYKPSHFSFNVDGGRCDVCQGEGKVTIEMQFMADIQLTCENCKGKRFKDEILDVQYRGISIFDLLEMTVEDAIKFFKNNPKSKYSAIESKIVNKLKPLLDVGLGYVCLGQSANTLSGGEAQRIKLAWFLSKGHNSKNSVFIFDEPTTGLHFHDIKKLLKSFNALIDQGNTVIVIEHNAEIIKCADWVIDLGPEGGDQGGNIVFEGVPEELSKCKESYTGKYLKSKLK